LGGDTNANFFAFIPKEKGASSDRFHPISLCNVSYKIMEKIITNRLNPMIRSLIISNQGGFMAGRKFWDNIILVQEVIHSSHSRGEKGLAIKLDMENAFDRVNHDFLKVVLKKSCLINLLSLE
jgi:mannosylglycoprotein endo-beta-mannosidase